MGKTLQIRVWAQTYDEADVEKRWPVLHGLAFGENEFVNQPKGVMELARTLADKARIAILSEPVIQEGGEGFKRCEELRQGIEKKLADWDPAGADKLSNELEELLDELEKRLKKV